MPEPVRSGATPHDQRVAQNWRSRAGGRREDHRHLSGGVGGCREDDTTYATYEMAAPHFEDFLHGPNAPLISEKRAGKRGVLSSGAGGLRDIPYDQGHRGLPWGRDGVYPTLDLRTYRTPAFDNETDPATPGSTVARDHYVWATTELGLRDRPYWHDLESGGGGDVAPSMAMTRMTTARRAQCALESDHHRAVGAEDTKGGTEDE